MPPNYGGLTRAQMLFAASFGRELSMDPSIGSNAAAGEQRSPLAKCLKSWMALNKA